MRKKVDHPHDGKSLKTLFIYAAVVVVLILASLAWKAFLIFQQSKFSNQHFTLALSQNEKVKELVVFNPADESMSVLQLTDEKINLKDLAKQTGISTDGQISSNDTSEDVIRDSVSETLLFFAFRYPTLQKNITILDTVRLSFYAKNLPPNKLVIKKLSSSELIDDPLLRKLLIEFFSDDLVATENMSIQIVNAAGTSGIAQRLERVLLLKGANVVAVTTAVKKEQRSKIKYFGQESYTLGKVSKLLGYQLEELPKETIANIVIVIGEDSKNTTLY
jgi:hypothetical protein